VKGSLLETTTIFLLLRVPLFMTDHPLRPQTDDIVLGELVKKRELIILDLAHDEKIALGVLPAAGSRLARVVALIDELLDPIARGGDGPGKNAGVFVDQLQGYSPKALAMTGFALHNYSKSVNPKGGSGRVWC
jgi:hypothetical protein